MLINEVCKECNLTKKAVEYYTEQGLIQPRITENGYRQFSETDTLKLKRIAVLRGLGFSVPEIRTILENDSRNNYEGVPYEGIALYKITLDNDAKQDFLKWSILPLSESAELFLTSISDYVELPEIADGYWMLVDRNPGTQKYTNVSFCIYDTAEEVAYMITMDS